jgi:hypothetical protein
MTLYQDIENFIVDNYGVIILVMVVGGYYFWKKIMQPYLHRRTEDKERDFNYDEAPSFLRDLPEIPVPSMVDSYQDQKKKALAELEQLKDDGKKLVADEQRFMEECKTKHTQFVQEKRNYNMRYTMCINHIKMLEDVVQNQKIIDGRQKKRKYGFKIK